MYILVKDCPLASKLPALYNHVQIKFAIFLWKSSPLLKQVAEGLESPKWLKLAQSGHPCFLVKLKCHQGCVHIEAKSFCCRIKLL
jgi:hypothetical protein